MNFMKNSILILCLIFLIGCFKIGGSKTDLSAYDLSKVDFTQEIYPTIILGGGVGGLTAATYLSQANIKTIVLEGSMPGGTISLSDSVRNWPGEIEISGKDLAEKIKNQTIKNGTKITPEEIIDVNFSVWPYIIKTRNTENGTSRTLKALSCIIAMGATPNRLNVEGEKKFFGKGVSACAVCDGPLYKNKVVAVVGGSDAAISEANYLSNIAKKVLIFVRRNKLRVSGKMVDEVLAKENVEVFYNTEIKKIYGDDNKVTHVIAFDNKHNEEKKQELDGIFLAIGATPNTSIFKNQLELSSKGFIILKNDQQTYKPGVFAIGDISDPKYKQAITAAGSGCKAALQTQDFLEAIGFEPSMLEKRSFNISSEEPQKETKPLTTEVIEVSTPQEFQQEVLDSEIPVVIDFYADWCGPCKQIQPIFKELANTFANKVKFVKINIDKMTPLTQKLSITGIPTFILIDNGEEIKRIQGIQNLQALKKIISNTFGLY